MRLISRHPLTTMTRIWATSGALKRPLSTRIKSRSTPGVHRPPSCYDHSMSSVLRARVQSGKLIVEDRVDLPEGAQVHLRIVENEDELDDEDRALLHREIDLSRAEAANGATVSAQEALAALRAARRE